VVSNGTAVLGLGNIGALAGKPVMEGKAVLFKRFADIDVFDIELDTEDPEEIIRTCQILEPTFGGINLEDIKAPECFYIEETLRKTMKIPVFHDDQHGTAIISGAGLLNALELGGKKIGDIKVVFNGAGAAPFPAPRTTSPGRAPREHRDVRHQGRDLRRPHRAHEPVQGALTPPKTSARTLAEAMVGADVFFGLSAGGCVTPEMVKGMAPNPIIFAMANPDPEIPYDDARPRARRHRGHRPQRLSQPGEQRPGLPLHLPRRAGRARHHHQRRDEAGRHRALARWPRKTCPTACCAPTRSTAWSSGREYIIPKPFDPRVLIWEASAVAQAAMDTGVAQQPVDIKQYREELERRLGKANEVMRGMINKAQRQPKRIVFTEGEEGKILRACQILLDEKIALPILLGDEPRSAPRSRNCTST
jgi:malate dehydrogenase (oxaloacetate-decarboxylating)(NADP+)